jgi:hypothetical protein
MTLTGCGRNTKRMMLLRRLLPRFDGWWLRICEGRRRRRCALSTAGERYKIN